MPPMNAAAVGQPLTPTAKQQKRVLCTVRPAGLAPRLSGLPLVMQYMHDPADRQAAHSPRDEPRRQAIDWPARSGLSSASPNAKCPATVQRSQCRVTVCALTGKP